MSPWRLAAWGGAALLLLVPVVAGQFTEGFDWSAGDFVFAGLLLFGSLGAFEVVSRKTGARTYRAGVGLTIVATFLLLWSNGAVSITDSVADAMYYGVALLGVVGIIVALGRPGAGARVVFAAAAALVVAGAITLAGGYVPNPYVSVLELLGITGFFAVLFGGAAWLLREAAQHGAEADGV